MAVSVLGIADDTALGCLMRVVVTRPSGLTSAKRAVDRAVDAIDAAARRIREASEMSRPTTRPEPDVIVSPLPSNPATVTDMAYILSRAQVDPTIGFAIKLA